MTDPTTTAATPRMFPGSYRGIIQSGRTECDVFELEYEGTLPPAIDGAYYRCGGDPQFPPRIPGLPPAEDFINGDGVVSMFRIRGGHVDFKMRYVRTERFLLERRARRALFGRYRNPFTDDPSVAGADRTLMNTAMHWHAGRLFALKEDGLAHEIDPLTLETRGKWDFGGQLRARTMTAHPKIDPLSGEWVFNGYSPLADEISTEIAFCVADADGELTREDWFRPPYSSMLHDWGVTQEHVVFPIMPLAADPERLRAGGARWAWDDARPTYLGVMPRRASVEDIRYFEGPPRWSFHVMNAFSEGSRVHVDLNVGEVAPFPDPEGRMPDLRRAGQYLTRWTCDLGQAGGTFEERCLWDRMPVDFPDVDQRFQTLPYRHGFMAGRDPEHPGDPRYATGIWFNTLAHVDHQTGEVDTYYVGDDAAVQEPVYVRKSDQSPEGDGYLLTVVNRFPEARGEMLVFDALRLSEGPIATVRAPLFLRPVTHSNWVSEEQLRRASGS
jgi:carotenoid cleavage dioxygenase-like enzyme